MERKEQPAEERERLRQKELKSNTAGSLQEGFNRAANGSLTDLAGDLGWKGIGVLITVFLIGYFIYQLLF
ncbi:DUF6366 family protein [Lysinibacillus odysseyi]|uniref:Phage capsid protein n=1 Tax=Lysinibacillus odysseyi 34hs-1 = NBRC 100172 TaxID=1220589 RepID=A0A0A3IIE4_9BACI|nr:DUF6366 family protein [Lysinibacillus odysseyi]KGR84541.1 phage capsid protein [Lysinibacillus odysseyi 34hs-1 = NBRC 100172]